MLGLKGSALKLSTQKSLMAKLSIFAAATALIFALPITAQAEWKIKRLTGKGSIKTSGALHPAVSCSGPTCFRSKERPFFEEGMPAPNGLPDGKIAQTHRYKNITQTWYILPTKRYDHGILGDTIEAGGLAVKTGSGKVITFNLPKTQVFEDRIPRIADLDGDGKAEIITILSSISKGASIAIYELKNGALVSKAKTPFIGRSNRWLNIAGIADFNGDGRLDIAGVWTPHIGGTLKFWTLRGNSLKNIGSMSDFSNHFIGSREQRLSAIADVDLNGTLDLTLPSAGRDVLRMVGFVKGRLKQLASLKLPRQIDKAIAVTRQEKYPIFTIGLSDDTSHAVFR